MGWKYLRATILRCQPSLKLGLGFEVTNLSAPLQRMVTVNTDIPCNDRKYSVPSAPQDIKAASINSDTILVSWKEPERKNGEILSYTLYKQHERVEL